MPQTYLLICFKGCSICYLTSLTETQTQFHFLLPAGCRGRGVQLRAEKLGSKCAPGRRQEKRRHGKPCCKVKEAEPNAFGSSEGPTPGTQRSRVIEGLLFSTVPWGLEAFAVIVHTEKITDTSSISSYELLYFPNSLHCYISHIYGFQLIQHNVFFQSLLALLAWMSEDPPEEIQPKPRKLLGGRRLSLHAGMQCVFPLMGQ